jgi:4-amino-4-deoxy-L-arabinose transferase-like glycosyltransferase
VSVHPITVDHGRGAGRSRRRALWPWGLMLTLLAAAFLACDIASRPIALWDESRLAVNALEMSQHGFSLTTTYGFQPDLWNTKPPLLIWLEAGSIRIFGASEWAVRLPSFLAALATVFLVMQLSWRLGYSRFVGLAAPLMLLLSPGYFGMHAAQSADYEMLLCFFTTAYLLLLFELLHQRRPDPGRVMLCGLLVAGACLTKGVAGLVPGTGVLAYVLVSRRWPRLFKTPWYLVAGLIAAILVGGFYLLRERAAPGYLNAVIVNELGDRYLRGMNGHIWPAYYYVQCLIGVLLPSSPAPLFSLGPLLLLLFVAPFLRWRPTKSAAFLTYATVVSLGLLLIYSLSRTKIFWYIVPIYPIVSIALAIVAERLLQMLPHRPQWPVRVASLLVAVAVIYMVGNALVQKVVLLPPLENTPQARYGLVFAQLDRQGRRNIRTLDGGVQNNDNLADYTPQRRFYTLVWRARGLDIRVQDPDQPVAPGAGQVVVTCDPRYRGWVGARGASLTSVAGCAAAPGA